MDFGCGVECWGCGNVLSDITKHAQASVFTQAPVVSLHESWLLFFRFYSQTQPEFVPNISFCWTFTLDLSGAFEKMKVSLRMISVQLLEDN